MTTSLDYSALRSLLDQPHPHEITAAAHSARCERFGLRTSVVAAAHLDPAGTATHAPVSGELAPEGGFPRELSALPDCATELFVLAPAGADEKALLELAAILPSRPDSQEFGATVQVGCADDWIEVDAGTETLAQMKRHGVRSISDAAVPRVHPAAGDAQTWATFWKRVADAGLRGHATVVYGPEHGLDSVFEQLEILARVQRETGVFLGLAPCIVGPEGSYGSEDHLLTQASLDLRVMAACRLYDTGVDHVGLRYERSDLKSAHTALACGVDDLLGHLHLSSREKKGDVEARDLSLMEMQRWLIEAGFEGRLRNGAFEMVGFEEVSL